MRNFNSQLKKIIKQGLKDESVDILCRYCDMFAEEVSFKQKMKKLFRRFR